MYAIGLDFGSTAIRALIVDLAGEREVASASTDYPCGTRGVCLKEDDPLLARQNPDAYIAAMTCSIRTAVEEAKKTDPAFAAEKVAGIGVDATSATIIPVTQKMIPLSRLGPFKDNLNAFAWMWKDHTALAEADEITLLAEKEHPEYLSRCGGSYSAEWFWSKVLHALRCDRKVFDASFAWVELCDFIPAVLAGLEDYSQIRCSAGAAGHKAMYAEDWGGLPDEKFLSALDPALVPLRGRLYKKAYASSETAGTLSPEWAGKLGLQAGTPLAVGMIDAHAGAAGSGAGPGKMVSIIGTSTCDITVAKFSGDVPEIKGISGIAQHSVLPGYYGIEGGHAAVGDAFFWQASSVGGVTDFARLEQEAARLTPSPDSVIAIDWLNGNRNPYADEKLKGIMVNLTLHTTLAEMYRAWLEATAFGIRQVTDILAAAGFEISELICAGGIPEKSPLLMQIYADVLDKKMLLPASRETCALGAALCGAAAGKAVSSVEEAQKKLCKFRELFCTPDPARKEIYDLLYSKYCLIGKEFAKGSLAKIMHS
ncbi:MAG: ribulokinase [Lentisphaeria bacterium]|nr:ribulokinase [Lentisphaeria bacterium]